MSHFEFERRPREDDVQLPSVALMPLQSRRFRNVPLAEHAGRADDLRGRESMFNDVGVGVCACGCGTRFTLRHCPKSVTYSGTEEERHACA